MAIRTYTNWNRRTSDKEKQKEPYKKYFFICEGVNTEQYYFKHLIDIKKTLGIKPVIDMRLLEKDNEDSGISFPLNLIEYANKLKSKREIDFDKKRDKMIIVFDADIFEFKSDRYDEIVEKGKSSGNILGVTNPSFELFLLLHFDGSFEQDILGNEEEYLKEENLSKKGYVYQKLLKKTKMNSRKNPNIGELANNIFIAIKQEKLINQDIECCKGRLTSNIGKIVESIIKDEGESDT